MPLFGELLRRHRIRAGLTQEDLAERAGLSADGISALERGARRRPQKGTVDLLVAALSLPAEARVELLVAARSGRAAGGATGPCDALTGGVPEPPTPLIGREPELEIVGSLVTRADVRLVTLTGPPGVGKTRLALAVASRLRGAFPDGGYAVSLAPLADPSLVWPTVRQALGVKEVAGQPPLETLTAFLRSRRALLLLDNFEHILDAAPMLADLLARCAELRVLVTSRTSIRIRGEHRVVVPPLAVPADDVRLEPDALVQVPAVALFVDRARASWYDFELTSSNAAAVAEICRQLDGLPLALELAAAWVPVIPPEALLARVREHRLAMLVGGALDLPDRQRTLSATLQWSYELLSEAERALFRRLAIFAGSAPLDAVDPVCMRQPSAATDALGMLAALVDKNLIGRLAHADGPEVRFTMLTIVREYGQQLLQAGGETEATARAHTDHYLALARTAEAHLTGPEQTEWLARLEREHDNLRAVLGRAVEDAEVETGLQLAACLRLFWERHGHWQEGLAWLDRLLADAGQVPAAMRARALTAAGILARRQSDYAGAESRFEASLALNRSLGNQPGVFAVLNNLGLVAHQRGQLTRAASLHRECLALCRTFGTDHAVAASLSNLGMAVQQLGEVDEARALMEEALALQRTLADKCAVSMTLLNLGDVARLAGDLDRAEKRLVEALALAREIGDEHTTARALATLGHVALSAGDAAATDARSRESLAMCIRLNDLEAAAYSLECLAAAAWLTLRAHRAASLYGAADAVRDGIGAPAHPAQRAEHESVRAELRAALGEAAYAAAVAAGRRQTPDEAVAAPGGQLTLVEGRSHSGRPTAGP